MQPGNSGRTMRAIVCVFRLHRRGGRRAVARDRQGLHQAGRAAAPWRWRPRRAAPPPPQQVSTSYRTVKLEGDRPRPFPGRCAGRRPQHRLRGRHRRLEDGAPRKLGGASSASSRGRRNTPAAAQTANGVGKYAPVRLNRVEVNGITVYDVEAAVMPDSALSDEPARHDLPVAGEVHPRPRPAGAGTIEPSVGYLSGIRPEIRCFPSPSRR